MPAKSKSQQRLMGMVYAYKNGDLKLKNIKSDSLKKKIKDISKGISLKDAKDFATTKRKKLPQKVEESINTLNDLFVNSIKNNIINYNNILNVLEEDVLMKKLDSYLIENYDYIISNCIEKNSYNEKLNISLNIFENLIYDNNLKFSTKMNFYLSKLNENAEDIFNADDEDYNNDELEVGVNIEKEHEPTVDKIKKYYDLTGEFPDPILIYKSIAKDHMDEYDDYYNDKDGLPAMERELAKKHGKTEDEDEYNESLDIDLEDDQDNDSYLYLEKIYDYFSKNDDDYLYYYGYDKGIISKCFLNDEDNEKCINKIVISYCVDDYKKNSDKIPNYDNVKQYLESKYPKYSNEDNIKKIVNILNKEQIIKNEKKSNLNVLEFKIFEEEMKNFEEVVFIGESKDYKRTKRGILYNGELFPGFNKPKSYIKGKHGKGNYKKRVLAKEGDDIAIVNYGDRDYEDYTQHKDNKRKENFRKRQKCDPVSKLSKLTAKYWSCQDLW